MDSVAGPAGLEGGQKLKQQIRRLRRLNLEAEAEIARLSPAVDLDAALPVFHRAAFLRELEQCRQYCRQYATNACLAVIDIDSLEDIRRVYGYGIDERVLKHAANQINRSVRKSDFVGRLGDSRFGIVLTRTKLANGYLAAQRIADGVSSTPVTSAQGDVEIVTSFDVVQFDGSRAAADLLWEMELSSAGRRQAIMSGSN